MLKRIYSSPGYLTSTQFESHWQGRQHHIEVTHCHQ